MRQFTSLQRWTSVVGICLLAVSQQSGVYLLSYLMAVDGDDGFYSVKSALKISPTLFGNLIGFMTVSLFLSLSLPLSPSPVS